MSTGRSIRVIAVAVLAAVGVMGQTQQPAVKKEKIEVPATGSITGRVINENGQPLSGAGVQIRTIGATVPGQSTITNREGEFKFTGLDRGEYVVAAVMPAYTPAPRDPASLPQPTYHIGDSVTLTLIKGGVLTGSVTNANGEAIVGVNVRAQLSRDSNGRRVATGWAREAFTDDRGVYRIYGLQPGTYVVSAGGASSYTSLDGNAFDGDVPTYAPSATRDSATEISVRGGEEVSAVDIRYRGDQGRIVSGAVKMASDAWFNVILSAAGEGAVPWQTTTYSQDGASFMFNGIEDGEYQLLAMAYPRNGPRELSAAVKKITVRGADATGIELTTVPLATVSGRVVLEESKAPECGEKQQPAFSEIVISAWHNDNEAAKETPVALWSIGAPATADAEGGFVLRNLAGGEYYFATRVTAKYWYLQSIMFAPPAARATAKKVDATVVWTKLKMGERLSGLTVTVAKGAASLRGQVVSEQIPEKLFVFLVPSEQEKADAVLRFYATPVTPDGKIVLHNIAPGRYWVVAQRVTENVATPLTNLRLPHASEARARLHREAEAAKTEIEFKPCQNVVDFQVQLKP